MLSLPLQIFNIEFQYIPNDPNLQEGKRNLYYLSSITSAKGKQISKTPDRNHQKCQKIVKLMLDNNSTM